MSWSVFFAVILAALLHATWNALAKSGSDKHRSMTAVVLGHTIIAVALLPFLPLPSVSSLPYLAAGVVLHVGYQFFLLASYRIGDLTQVYPIARGSAPLLVAAVSVLLLGVELQALEIIGILTIAAGVMSLGLVRQKDGLRNVRAGLLAFATGCFIASYSLVDGMGARLAGSALGFYAWLTIGNAIVFGGIMAFVRPRALLDIPSHGKVMLFFGGGASFIAYALVIWAFTQAPIALVTALRETSIVFALLIGVFVLKEKLDLAKLFSTTVTLLGAGLMRFAKS
ncbi:MAG: EamA family transporter [Geminicoccaceae bacterium]